MEKAVKQNKHQEKILGEYVDLLYKNSLVSLPSSFICATLIFVALYRIPHSMGLIYWYEALTSILGIRLVLFLWYFYHPKDIKLNYYLFLLTVIITAMLWALVSLFLLPDGYHVEQMVVIVVLAGIITGGAQALQASLVIALIYIYVIITPILIWGFSQAESAYQLLGIAFSFYFIFTFVICWRGNKFVNETLRLKHENIDLAKHLSSANVELQGINQDLTEKQDNLRLINDNAPIGMAVVSLDGKWLSVNNRLCGILGYSKEELENLHLDDVIYEGDLGIDREKKVELLSGLVQSFQAEKRYVTKAKKIIWISVNVSLVHGKDGKPLYYISQIEDINDKKQNELVISKLANMNGMLQLCHNSIEAYPIISHTAQEIFSGVSGGLSIVNTLTNEQEAVARWGKNSLLKSSFKSEDCWAFRSGKVYVVNDPDKESICNHFDSKPITGYICLPLIVQGEVFGLLNFNAPADRAMTNYQHELINNFSETVKLSLANIHLNETLSEQVIHDPLTGLLNRRYLYEYLPQILQHAVKTKHSLCVCMLDLDDFKNVNDTYGHEAGDAILKYMGTFLKKSIRESDVACRFGGEEFLIILMGTDLQHANTQMDRIRNEVKQAQVFVQDTLISSFTLSIGVAEAPRHGETINEILRAADEALYAAKAAGKDRVVNASLEKGKSN